MHFEEDSFYIEKTRQGDLAAYGRLVQKHESYAFTLAFRILKNKEEAEEAAQDAFIKAYEGISSFEGKSKFTTWLYKIVYYESLTKLRKNKHYFLDIEEIGEKESVENSFMNGFDEIQSAQRKELIQSSLREMKPAEATILSLFYLQEQSIKEIETITEYSNSQVKILLHRGRKSLLECLKRIAKKELSELL